MTIDLLAGVDSGTPWADPAAYWAAMTDAVAGVSGPVAALNLAALRYNALDMVIRSSGVPIRVASKSVRVRDVLDATLALPGYHGILAFTLPEALWLAETHDDVVLGYPSVDRAALAVLAADERAASRVTLMVDDLAQLDVVDSVVGAGARARRCASRSTPMRRGARPAWVTSECAVPRCTSRARSPTWPARSPRGRDSASWVS